MSNTYTGKNDWGIGVGSLLCTSLRILLIPLLPDECVIDWREVKSPVLSPVRGEGCCRWRNAGLNGVEVALEVKPTPNTELPMPP